MYYVHSHILLYQCNVLASLRLVHVQVVLLSLARPIVLFLDDIVCVGLLISRFLVFEVEACFLLPGSSVFTEQIILMDEGLEALEGLNNVTLESVATLCYCDSRT